MLEILRPIEYVVAWIMVTAHDLLTSAGMDPTSGWTWALSIVALVVVIRVVLIPLFVKQIKASRGMQIVAPEVRKIQQKYKGKTDPASRQKMTEETMAAYKKAGTNPFASCLPILLQMPIFFALFQVLNGLSAIAAGDREPIGRMTQDVAAQAEASSLLGAPLSSTFLGSDDLVTKLVTVLLIVLMSVTTFTTQRQLMTKNMPASMADNPMAQQQKIIMYVLPLVFAVTGVNFPIGVLLYWLTTNVWSMAQQFYVIRNMPAPGSAAEAKLLERKARKQGTTVEDLTKGTATGPAAAGDAPRGQRVQPRRKDRQRRPGEPAAGEKPAGGTDGGERSGGQKKDGPEEDAQKSGDGEGDADGDAAGPDAAPAARRDGAGAAGAAPGGANGTGAAHAPGRRRPTGSASRNGQRGRQGSRPAAKRPSRGS
ncbi:membrane protein insertase YidC [uncultured Pseudokineococcus sp.]|uniref:membrane protein insertase YidC n=1 Tax=uncultured Pseudokineococcus sp. TaxID=1642928 RepID=UPI002612EA14|nr:membrane protein insertase YidC [uncultured Pseudokineococcus sp.]